MTRADHRSVVSWPHVTSSHHISSPIIWRHCACWWPEMTTPAQFPWHYQDNTCHLTCSAFWWFEGMCLTVCLKFQKSLNVENTYFFFPVQSVWRSFQLSHIPNCLEGSAPVDQSWPHQAASHDSLDTDQSQDTLVTQLQAANNTFPTTRLLGSLISSP